MTTEARTLEREAAEEKALRFLSLYWPQEEKDCEFQYFVEHSYGHSFVRLAVYGRRDTNGKRLKRSAYYRFNNRILTTVLEMQSDFGHGAGICSGCTQRWRIQNGLGADTADLRDMPGWEADEVKP